MAHPFLLACAFEPGQPWEDPNAEIKQCVPRNGKKCYRYVYGDIFAYTAYRLFVKFQFVTRIFNFVKNGQKKGYNKNKNKNKSQNWNFTLSNFN
jgi:hypothetical protein